MMKEKVAHSLARTGETLAKVHCGLSFCYWLLHEPKMPAALQKKIAEKELWKK